MNIKKLCAYYLIFLLSLTAFSPALATTNGTTDVDTSLIRESTGGNDPIVKSKWEMNTSKGTDGKYLGTDDSTTAGAQFTPSGIYQVGKKIAVCAVVTDPDGLADIDSVYADIFYPETVALGPNHESDRQGCGQEMPEFTLTKFVKADGIELFCNKIRSNNSNLPVFNTDYDYDEICAQDGELMKETAAVFCGEHTLSYEDPSGNYRTLVLAQDKYGLDGTLENYFTYQALTAFETDFSKINYGTVKLNTHKIINGDLAWDVMDQGKASVRNIGNTRLNMKVWQDDMGLGKTDGNWNVKYDARVGSDAVFANYYPETTKVLADILNLSETDEMDFSIDISKWPPTHEGNSYTGNMVLSAQAAQHLTCTCPNSLDGTCNSSIDGSEG